MGFWEQVGGAIRDEFSDIPDAGQFARITLRLLIAAILGGLLGFERESKGKSAGLRTHMLVALGAALFVLIPQQTKVTDAQDALRSCQPQRGADRPYRASVKPSLSARATWPCRRHRTRSARPQRFDIAKPGN